ncbi:MAG: ExeA family protein [Pseudomonadales bacterium]
MYKEYFGFSDLPFSIAPDPNYLYLSEQHKEALAHLLYGVGEQGGFVLLSGEVGTGKTTICRALLHQIPAHCEVAYVVNPRQTATELLQSICDEFGIYYFYEGQGSNYLVDLINEHLLALHSQGKSAVLIVDEAQNLGVGVLEQLRLLTNLETDQKKLLQLILLGQPELNELLSKPELRQLAQRITARHHLKALSQDELQAYIEHRLQVAGFKGALFTPDAIKLIYRKSQGIPRLINVICDRCLLGLYSTNGNSVGVDVAKRAVGEVMGIVSPAKSVVKAPWFIPTLASASLLLVLVFIIFTKSISSKGAEKEEDLHLATATITDKPTLITKEPTKILTAEDAKQHLLSRLTKRMAYEKPSGDSFQEKCDTLADAGLQCITRRGDLRDIQLLETNIIVNLPNEFLPKNQRDQSTEKQWVLLKAVPGEPIELEFLNQQRLSLPPSTLAQAWPVDYLWLWSRPDSYRQNLSLGESGDFVTWLSRAVKAYNLPKGIKIRGSSDLSERTPGVLPSSAVIHRTSFLVSQPGPKSSVVSTHLLRNIGRIKEQLNIEAQGISEELVYVLDKQLKLHTSNSELLGAIER